MCVVERRTYVHSDGRRDIVERARACHHASGNRFCRYVDYKDVEIARVVEGRPSSTRSSPPEEVVVTTGRGGHEKAYHPLLRRNSKRESTRRYSPDNDRSPVDSVSGPSSSLQPKYREVRPSAPTPPPISTTLPLPSARRSGLTSPTSPPNPTRTVGPDGAAIYSHPPSLRVPRAPINERASLPRRGPLSAAVDDEPEPEPPRRAPSNRKPRPSRVIINAAPSSPAFDSSSGSPSLPGLSNLPAVQSPRSRDSKGKRPSRDRADTVLDDPNQQNEAEQEARWKQERLEEAARLYQYRQRPAPSEAHRDTLDAPEGNSRPSPSSRSQREEDLQRRMETEKTQMARERAQAGARRRASCQPSTSSSSSSSSSSRPATSARRPAPPPPPRPPIVHHYNYPSDRPGSTSSSRNNALLERGNAVIAAQHATAATQKLEARMAGLEPEEEADV